MWKISNAFTTIEPRNAPSAANWSECWYDSEVLIYECFQWQSYRIFVVVGVPNLRLTYPNMRRQALHHGYTSMFIVSVCSWVNMNQIGFEEVRWNCRFVPWLLPKRRHGKADTLVCYVRVRAASLVFMHAQMASANTRECHYRWRYVPFLVRSPRNTKGLPP